MTYKRIIFTRGLLTFFFLCLLVIQVSAQPETMLYKKQKEFETWKYGMFLHFNMGTFVDKEWATGYEDPLLLNFVTVLMLVADGFGIPEKSIFRKLML